MYVNLTWYEIQTSGLPEIWHKGYKTVLMLISAEHEIFSADKYEYANKVGISIFIGREIFMLSYV